MEISSPEPASGPVPSGLVLALGSYRIEIERGFDRETLGQLLTLLERGRFHWPEEGEGKLRLSGEELALLAGGLDLSNTRRRAWFRRAV